MVAAVIFVLVFLVLGLGVVFLAFSGRAWSAPARRPHAGRAPVRGGGGRVVVVGLGVAVPLAIGWQQDDHAKSAPGGVDLTPPRAGPGGVREYCSTCHTLKASNAVGKVGPNLDVLHPPKGLVLDAIANGRARGQGQMPAGLVDGEDAQDVAAYVAAVAGRG